MVTPTVWLWVCIIQVEWPSLLRMCHALSVSSWCHCTALYVYSLMCIHLITSENAVVRGFWTGSNRSISFQDCCSCTGCQSCGCTIQSVLRCALSFGGSCRACLTRIVQFDNARPLCSSLWSASSTNYAPTPSSASLHFFTLVFLLGMHCLRTFE